MVYQWADCDRYTVSRRYDRLAGYIPLFDRVLFLPKDSRRRAVDRLGLRPGDRVLDVGCGTGRSLDYLQQAVGPTGRVYGIDISPGMLGKAQKSCDAHGWDNVELTQCDAATFKASTPLNGVLFSLSYNTMPDHRAVLRRAWDQLMPGGRLVIMDAKVPLGASGKLVLPFSLWLMRHTMLGNPLIHPWEELARLTEQWDMSQRRFNSYYICCGIKRGARLAAAEEAGISDAPYLIAAEQSHDFIRSNQSVSDPHFRHAEHVEPIDIGRHGDVGERKRIAGDASGFITGQAINIDGGVITY